jgi:hypothetical protein
MYDYSITLRSFINCLLTCLHREPEIRKEIIDRVMKSNNSYILWGAFDYYTESLTGDLDDFFASACNHSDIVIKDKGRVYTEGSSYKR